VLARPTHTAAESLCNHSGVGMALLQPLVQPEEVLTLQQITKKSGSSI
jgi:hypothetical protein